MNWKSHSHHWARTAHHRKSLWRQQSWCRRKSHYLKKVIKLNLSLLQTGRRSQLTTTSFTLVRSIRTVEETVTKLINQNTLGSIVTWPLLWTTSHWEKNWTNFRKKRTLDNKADQISCSEVGKQVLQFSTSSPGVAEIDGAAVVSTLSADKDTTYVNDTLMLKLWLALGHLWFLTCGWCRGCWCSSGLLFFLCGKGFLFVS